MTTLKKVTSGNTLPYAILEPDALDKTKPVALGVFLHGLGERSGTVKTQADIATFLNTMVNAWGPIRSIQAGKVKTPILWVEPQLPPSIGNWSWDYVKPVIDAIESLYLVDRAKMYLTGLSLGGGGCDYILNEQPDLFAAIAALSPSKGFDASIAPKITSALWYKHNLNDTIVSPTYSINSIVALWNNKGWVGTKNTILNSKPVGLQTAMLTDDLKIKWTPGNVPGGLTLNEMGGHGGWQDVYDSQAFYDWLLSKTKGQVEKQLKIASVNVDPSKLNLGAYEFDIMYQGQKIGSLDASVN